MGIDPTKYAKDRIKEREKSKKSGGAIVTISREFGCPAKTITKDLVTLINKTTGHRWSYVSKEILAESAKELGIPPSEIKHFFKYHEQGVFDGMLTAIAKFYASDHKIYNAIEKTIRSIGNKGNVIIVGRGGAAICNDFEKALHIRLMAPLEWRVEKIMQYYKLEKGKATRFILDYDEKRKKFMGHFLKSGAVHSLFDVIYNCKSLEKRDIVHSIYDLLKARKML